MLKQKSFRRSKYRWSNEVKAKNNICASNNILIENLTAEHSETNWIWFHKKSKLITINKSK